jgi:hypothetical protein
LTLLQPSLYTYADFIPYLKLSLVSQKKPNKKLRMRHSLSLSPTFSGGSGNCWQGMLVSQQPVSNSIVNCNNHENVLGIKKDMIIIPLHKSCIIQEAESERKHDCLNVDETRHQSTYFVERERAI